jgi:hypothetical protein
MKKLGSSDSVLNNFYKQMMQEAYGESKEGLLSIGIAADKNGNLGDRITCKADRSKHEKSRGQSDNGCLLSCKKLAYLPCITNRIA